MYILGAGCGSPNVHKTGFGPSQGEMEDGKLRSYNVGGIYIYMISKPELRWQCGTCKDYEVIKRRNR